MAGTTDDDVARVLDTLSKAALIDLYTQALARCLGECDTPPTISDVVDDANLMLALRGDRLLKQ